MRRVLLAAMLAGASVGAQVTPGTTSTPVVVRVRDTTGAAIGGAAVAIVRGLNDAVAAGTTDDRGRVALRITADDGDYHLVVRRIGYERAERFFRVARDSLAFDLVLRRVAQSLDPVVVTAAQDLKRKSYHIDADEIATSTRVLIDATDILAKLRPDMICGRNCRPLAAVAVQSPVRKCPTLVFQQPVRVTCPVDDTPPPLTTYVWVNGRRIRTVAPNEMAVARQQGLLAGLSAGSMTVLSEIKPEHIAEMTYIDEFDNSVGKIGSNNALFVVLKPGIAYEPGRESYVVDADATSKPAPLAASAASVLPGYRYRLLGVFDRLTGDPIAGADVIDMTTGTRARTSTTGTVSLIFLPEGGTPVRITKPGYEDLTLAVEISAETAEPLTLVMDRSP